jgi:hypothetical protein
VTNSQLEGSSHAFETGVIQRFALYGNADVRRYLKEKIRPERISTGTGFRTIVAAVIGMFVVISVASAQTSSPATQSVAPNIQLPSDLLDRLKPISMPKPSAVLRAMKVDLAAE